MILEHIGLSQINGSLVVLDGVKGVPYDEMAELHLDDGSTPRGPCRSGRRRPLHHPGVRGHPRHYVWSTPAPVLTGHP